MARDSAYYSPAETVQKGGVEFSLGGENTFSTGMYDEDGDEVDFAYEEDYEREEYRGGVRYGLSDKLELNGRLNYRKNRSWNEDGDREEVDDLESVGLGLRYQLVEKSDISFALSAEVRALLSEENGEELLLGDEGEYFRMGVAQDLSLGGNFHIASQVNLVLPAKDQSIESGYDFTLYWDQGSFALGVGINGIYSYERDDYSDNPEDKPVGNRGSTHTIASVNRSFVRGHAVLNLKLPWGLLAELRGGQVMQGSFWDQESFGSFSLVYRNRADRSQEVRSSFKQYDVEAQVLKVSPEGTFVKIDRGLSDGIQKGIRFDIYEVDFRGNSVLIASGRVFKVGLDSSIVKILKIFDENGRLAEGQVARGGEVMNKTRIATVFLMLFSLLPAAQAKTFNTEYIEFQLPAGWDCSLEGSEWVCQSQNEERKREAIIIMAAKEKGDQDGIPQYFAYLKEKKQYELPNRKAQVSVPKYTKKTTVNDHVWVDSLHLASEVPGFYTRYMATTRGDLGIAVTFSVAKDHYDSYQELFQKIIESMRTFAVTRGKIAQTLGIKKEAPGSPLPVSSPGFRRHSGSQNWSPGKQEEKRGGRPHPLRHSRFGGSGLFYL